MRRLNVFLNLVRNEWRDVRALTVVCMALVPLALLAVDLGFLDWRADFAGTWFVPGVLLLYAVVVCSDLVAAEVSTGRARTYACLPVSPAARWWAKIAFVVVAVTAFAAWTFGTTFALYAAFAPEARSTGALLDHLRELDRAAVAGGVALAAATLLWSSVLDRGLAAIGAALVTGAVIAGILPLVALREPELLPDHEHVLVALWVLPAVFLLGSYVAFVRGPVHAGTLLRRAVLALGVVGALVLPTGAAWAGALLDRLNVEPGDPGVRVYLGSVSPDRRHALLFAQRSHRHAEPRAWVLDLADGRITVLPGKGYWSAGYSAWSPAGNVYAWNGVGAGGLRREFDPATGEIVRTRSYEQLLADGSPPYAETSWGTATWRNATTTVRLRDGEEVEVPARVSLTGVPHVAFDIRDDVLELRDVLDGSVRRVELPRTFRMCHAAPGGAYLRAADARGSVVVDVARAEIVLDTAGYVGWPGGGSDDRYVILQRPGRQASVLDLVTGEHVAAPEGTDVSLFNVRLLDAHRWLASMPDGRLTLLDPVTGATQILYEPRSDD